MTIATALVSGNDPLPYLAETAIGEALERGGLQQAQGVLLFLTPEFARNAQTTVTAAARAARCLQVAGGIAAGVFTETGWVLDRPAVAAMVFGGDLLPCVAGHAADGDEALSGAGAAPLLSLAGGALPTAWQTGRARFGACFNGALAPAEPAVWQQARLDPQRHCVLQLRGARVDIGVSSGLRLLGNAQPVDESNGYDLDAIGGLCALHSLQRALPAECHAQQPLALHPLSAVLIEERTENTADDTRNALIEGRYRPIPIIAANADGSLTLAERVQPGQRIAWAIRQALPAEADMRQTLARLATGAPAPAAALLFSCIGRGPYFYGGEDRDLDVLRERFPGLPLLGVYGTGQIAPRPGGNVPLHNAAVTALISRA